MSREGARPALRLGRISRRRSRALAAEGTYPRTTDGTGRAGRKMDSTQPEGSRFDPAFVSRPHGRLDDGPLDERASHFGQPRQGRRQRPTRGETEGLRVAKG